MAKVMVPVPDDEFAQFMADRVDAFKTALGLVDGREWHDGPTVYDVLSVAKWLAGDDN